jgi:hypothetical protein
MFQARGLAADKVACTLRRAVRTIVAGTLRRAVRRQAFAKIPGGRHMECAYYFVDGTWNVPTTLTFVGRASRRATRATQPAAELPNGSI